MYIIYTAYTYSCVCAHLVNIGMEQKTELGPMRNFTLLKTTIWWFSEVFFFFCCNRHNFSNMHFETDIHGVEIRLRCCFLSMQAVISCLSREPEKICHLYRTIVYLESLGMSYIWKLCHQQFLVGICKKEKKYQVFVNKMPI